MRRGSALLLCGGVAWGLAVGCRAGYEEIANLGVGAANRPGAGGSSGDSGGINPIDAGEAGMGDSTGGTVLGGTSGGSSVGGSAGASTAGGTAGSSTGASGGNGGAGGGSGGASGGSGAGGFAGASSIGNCLTEQFNGHDYALCDEDLTWPAARDACASIGMQLTRVDDDAESQWIRNTIVDSPPHPGIWIGASDGAVEGEWRWPDGDLFWLGDQTGSAQNGLHAGWYPVQPSASSPERDCAAIDEGGSSGHGWFDIDCLATSTFVCESF